MASRPGGNEVILRTAQTMCCTFYGDAILIVILILGFLRSLTNILKCCTEGVKDLADAYKSYEEGRLARQNRKVNQKACRAPNKLLKN
jgi:hypothetical protein